MLDDCRYTDRSVAIEDIRFAVTGWIRKCQIRNRRSPRPGAGRGSSRMQTRALRHRPSILLSPLVFPPACSLLSAQLHVVAALLVQPWARPLVPLHARAAILVRPCARPLGLPRVQVPPSVQPWSLVLLRAQVPPSVQPWPSVLLRARVALLAQPLVLHVPAEPLFQPLVQPEQSSLCVTVSDAV